MQCFKEGEGGQCEHGVVGFCKQTGERCLFAREPGQDEIDKRLKEQAKNNRRRWGLSILRGARR